MARLLGSPPGYIGSEDPNRPGSGAKVIFSQQNLDDHRIFYADRSGNQRRVIIILVDEAEKADRSFHMAFLSILDKGTLDIGNNTTSNFSDAIVFYTSNVGNETVERLHQQRETQQAEQAVPPAFREAFGEEAGEVSFSAEDKEIIRNEFINAFPPEFRGRIRETVVFNHLSKEAVSEIAKIKIKEVEQSFAENRIKIELDLTPAAKDWLVKHGYSRSEGARGMEKLVERALHETLIKLDSARDTEELSTGIHRKRIGVDVKEDGSGFDFYFGDGYQLEDFPAEENPQAAASTQAIAQQQVERPATPQPTNQRRTQAAETSEVPQVPKSIKDQLEYNMRYRGLEAFVRTRDDFVRKGLVDPATVNSLPEIRKQAGDSLLYDIQYRGLDAFISKRDSLVEAGIFSAQACNDWEPVKKQAEESLKYDLSYRGHDAFIRSRDRYVAAGIGTVKEWNQLLNS